MSEFLTVPFEVDADTLTDDAIESLQTAIPGWLPADGNLEVWLLAAFARIAAEVTTVAASVPAAIFRAYGTQMIGLPALDGEAATITTTWTAQDTAGYTAPAGTQVAHRVSGDTLIIFETTTDMVITPGSSSLAGVVLTAVAVGVDSNDVPTGAMELIDSLSWVSTIVATATSSGGVDAETDTAYLDRLAAELRLSSPRPILPDDFAILARRVEGVTRALAVDGYDPGTNEVQQIAITGSPTGGDFEATYSGQPATITFDSTAGAAQTALEGLSNIGVGDVSVTGGPLPGTPILIEFTGTLATTNVATITTVDSLTGGTTPASVVTTPTPGVAPSTGNERMITIVPLDADGAATSELITTALQTYLDGLREVSFVVNTAAPTSTTVDVVFTIRVATGFDSTTVVDACEDAVTAYLSPASWAGGDESPPVWRTGEDKVRYLALSAVLAAVEGVSYVATLTLNAGTSDITLTGIAPLPELGTLSGSAV